MVLSKNKIRDKIFFYFLQFNEAERTIYTKLGNESQAVLGKWVLTLEMNDASPDLGKQEQSKFKTYERNNKC